MARIGRPPEPVPQDKADSIVAWVSEGKTLRDWCRMHDVAFRTAYDWLEKDEEFAARFARAREAGHDAIADECLQIADEPPPNNMNGGTDSGYVAWQKNRIWTRTQLLAKWNPKKYGDRVEQHHTGSVGLSIAINLDGKQ